MVKKWKARIALLLAGVVLGSVSTGVAAPQVLPFWKKSQGPYICTGNAVGASCVRRYTAWKVLVSKQTYPAVAIFHADRPIFSCGRFEWPEECTDLRP